MASIPSAAEMGAAFLCAIAGIANKHTDRNTTAYIQNWISKLEEDNRLIIHAAANAQRPPIASLAKRLKRPRDEAQQAKWKAEQEKQRREEAIANATGLRVLSAIGSAVPVRLLKCDLLFIAERLLSLMDEPRIETLARQHGIRQKRDDGGVRKTLTAFLRRSDEGTLSRLLVEASILLAASRGNATTVLKDAATAYKVDTEAIATKVKQEFAAKAKAKKAAQPAVKVAKKAA